MTLLLDRPEVARRPAPPPVPAETPVTRPRHRRRRPLAYPVALLLVAEAFVLADLDVPVVRVLVGLAVLVAVPTWQLAAKVAWRSDDARWCYAFGLTLLGVMVAGLGLNTVLPLVGVERPLAPLGLVIVSATVNTALMLWRGQQEAEPVVVRWPALDLATLLGILAVLVAVGGAVRLNNGAGGGMAVIGLVLVGGVFAVLLLRTAGTPGGDARAVGLAALALLLATSLRGWYVTGHDVQKEYFVFRLAHDALHWRMEAFQDAYNACLSITVLPSVLATFTGVDGPGLFKVLLQLPFVLVPVMVYLLGRRLAGRRRALLGVVFFVSFPTFSNDMPFLVRQEVAFLFLTLVVLAATERNWDPRWRRTAAGLGGVGVILSHYATTYVLLLTLGIGLAGLLAVRLVRRRAVVVRPILLSPLLIGVLAVATWTWVNPITSSGGHAGQVILQTWQGLTGAAETQVSTDLEHVFSFGQVSDQERLDEYAADVAAATDEGRETGYLLPLPDDALAPEAVPDPVAPPTPLGRALEAVGVDPGALVGDLRGAGARMIQLFLLVGLAVLLLRRRRPAGYEGEMWFLSLAVFGALGVQALAPGISVEYGILRAFQQSLLFLAPLVAVGCVVAAGLLRRAATVAVAGSVAVCYLALVGVAGALLGGAPPKLALASEGDYHDIYYVRPAEVAAAAWVAREYGQQGITTDLASDPYTLARLFPFLRDVPTTPDAFFPAQLRHNGWVLVGSSTVEHGYAMTPTEGDRVRYEYPLDLLGTSFDRVYDNGDVEVYR